MQTIKLGNFEELVMHLVGIMYYKAYSVSIAEEYHRQTGKSVNISAIHTVLYRLEEKGFLKSRMGESEDMRGGKRKRLFYLTPAAKEALDQLASFRQQLRSQIPDIAFEHGI